MVDRAFARSFIALVFALPVASCGGGTAAPAAVQPPAAAYAGNAQSVAFSNPAPDDGVLLPLSVLTARTSGATPYAVSGCSSTVACIGGTNSSSGPGVSGVSSLGKGVTGATSFSSTTSSNGQYGVYGQDSSASGTYDAGVYGLSVRGTGASGKSTSGYGVRGTSGSIGVGGISTGNYGVYGSGPMRGVWGAGGPIGVYGNGSAEGVYGSSTAISGIAVYGSSPSYVGLYGSGGQYGVYGTSVSGTGGLLFSTYAIGAYGGSGTGTGVYATSSSGYALEAHSNGKPAIYANNTNGNAGDMSGSYIGVVARTPAGGFPFAATDPTGATNLFYVTGTGDIYYHGGLHSFAAMTSGTQAQAYSPQSTRPAIEDTGTARLTDGRASVALDPTFARTIDPGREYQVFLTPGGDTRGLYVASKSGTGFVVREAQGGRGTFSFDYHIYATALGRSAERMSAIAAPHAPNLAPQAASNTKLIAVPTAPPE